MVFVKQDEPALDGDGGGDPLSGLDRLIARDQRLFATAGRDFDVNWKIFHTSKHSDSCGPMASTT